MIDDIVLAKLAVIRRCLQRIQRKTGGDPETVDDIDIQDIVVLNLQRAIQATIDLAAHLITIHQWGLPASLKENFTLLAGQGVIDRELSRHLEAMVGFRNIAVHEYQALDIAVLKRVLRERLGDFAAFASAVKHFLNQP
ncbi:MAG: DUF86 domain-containing protein [Candidatus Competibacteraceae bacterium]